MNTTWRHEIAAEMKERKESWDDLVATTLTDEELDTKFDSGHWLSDGAPFTAWTRDRVYFPVVYGGAEWVGSVPRNPCDEKTEHMGGQ